MLRTRALISYHRDNITVLDRAGLIEASCGCYRADRSLYTQVLDDHG